MQAEIIDNDTGILYSRIDTIKIMPEADALNMFECDSIDDYIALLYADITDMESNYEYLEEEEEDGMDYVALCVSQGLSANVKC